MKNSLFAVLFGVGLLGVASTGCSAAVRSPEMFRDDVGKAFGTKNEEIRACYDGVLKGSAGAGGKVTIKFEVETEQGKIVNVAVDKAGTTAPEPVAECVTKAVAGLSIAPPDAKKGEGVWVFEFNAPPAPSAPKS